MPPLKLEQVLARAMRLPKNRARRATGNLFTASAPSANGAREMNRRKVKPSDFQRREALNFFDLLEREDAARNAGRLSIHTSDHLVRNSADLLTYLKAAHRMQAWEDALTAFVAATGLSLPQQQHQVSHAAARVTPLVPPPAPPAPPTNAPSYTPAPVHPSVEHVTALLDTLAAAEQWPLLLSVGQYYGSQHPAVLTHAVSAILTEGRHINGDHVAAPALVQAVRAIAPARDPAASAVPMTTYDAALLLLQHGSVRPQEIPVECFNAILSACEDAKDWRAALRVIRAMGPSSLQGWVSPEEASHPKGLGLKRSGGGDNGSDGGADTSDKPDVAPSPSPSTGATMPTPDVVSYATLIATLEQAGKDRIAAQVLNRLPRLEKEEITASYAALIYVWSTQVYNQNRRRHR